MFLSHFSRLKETTHRPQRVDERADKKDQARARRQEGRRLLGAPPQEQRGRQEKSRSETPKRRRNSGESLVLGAGKPQAQSPSDHTQSRTVQTPLHALQ